MAVLASDYSPQMVPIERPELTDEAEWIARAQRSDSNAFERLYRMHIDRVYGLCLRMTGNVSEAEDCAQEAFIQAWSKLDRFRGDSTFGTWLHRIAVNAVLGRIRKSKREQDRIQLVAQGFTVPVLLDKIASVHQAQKNIQSNTNLRLTLEALVLKLAQG